MRLLISSMVALSLPPLALAQSAPAAQQQGLGGPAIPGICLLSREAIFANAKAGVAASARLKQLADAAQNEVEAQRRPIDSDLEAFQKSAAKLTAEQRDQQQQALARRLQPVQQLAAQRNREIEATRAKAMERISATAQPIIAQVYGQHKCGLLVDRNTVLGGNFSNDLTIEIVRNLDTAMPSLSFEREALPSAAAAK